MSSCRRGVTLLVSLVLAMAIGVAFPVCASAEDEAVTGNPDVVSQVVPAAEPLEDEGQPALDGVSENAANDDQHALAVDQGESVSEETPRMEQDDTTSVVATAQATSAEPQEDGSAGEDSSQPNDGAREEEPPALPSHEFSLESGLSYGMVVDVKGGSQANGTNVQLYRSNGTAAQRWVLEAYGEAYYIVNRASGKVLDVAGGRAAKGTNVQLYQKNGSSAQLWLPKATGNGGVILRSMLGEDLVLDVSGASRANGANLQVWVDNGSTAQSFWFREVNPAMEAGKRLLDDGAYVLASAKSGKMVLDVAGGKTTNGANVQLYTSNGSNAQRFYASFADGFYTFQSCASGLALDVANSSPVAGANVQLYTPNHSAAQQWRLEELVDGVMQLTNRGTGLVLDISGGLMSNGANAQGYYANGTAAQLWRLTRTAIVADGCYTIQDSATNKALDVSSASLADGARVQRYASNGTAAQMFYLWNTGEGSDRYTVRNINSAKAIASSGDIVAQSSGTAMEWTIVMTDGGLMLSDGSRFLGFDGANKACLTTASKASHLKVTTAQFVNEGYYQLRLANGQVLDVSGQSTSAADATLAGSGSSLTQVWRLVRVSGSTYKLINVKSGLCLAVSSSNRARQMQGAEATQQWRVSWDARNGGIVFTNVAKGAELSFGEADGLVAAGTAAGSAIQKGRWFFVDKRVPAMQHHIAQVAEHFASHAAHGYSQPNRGAGRPEVIYMVDGTPVTISSSDVDCSEMARQCVNAALGYNAIGYMDTRCEDRLLKAMGLVRMAFSTSAVQRGDILWRQGHTAIALGGGKQAEAGHDEYYDIYGPNRGDNTGDEVAVHSLKTGGYWTYIYRYV